VLFFHYIDQIRRHGYRVLCLLLVEKGSTVAASDIERFKREVEAPGQCEVAAAVVDRLIQVAGASATIQAGRVDAATAERARRFEPELVLCFDIGAAAVARALDLRARFVAWLGDLNFQTFWFHARYDARERAAALLRLPKIWLICRRWKAAYRTLLRGADLVIVASASSQDVLRGLGVRSRYLPYPWPVDKPFRPAARHRSATGRPRFLFCGTLSGLGSRSALHYLFDGVYPELQARWGAGGFEIVITGARSLPAWAEASLRDRPEVAFLGYVEDLYAEMDRCHAAIVPIDVPVGNRSRIVTAMGYGLLVIAHPNTALGNPELVADKTCLLAETPREFARQMARAYEDPGRAERIELAARASYERNFEPRAAAALLIEQMDALLAERRGAVPAALSLAS